MGGTIEQDDVESSVIKRNVVFHHQIICDHFQSFSESLKNIKRYEVVKDNPVDMN